MGLGYAAATPAAVKWFGPHQRGLIVGLVVGGYGGAAIYISPLAKWLIGSYGLSGSFIGLGCLFAVVVIIAGQLLSWPPAGYVPPAGVSRVKQSTFAARDWSASEMVRTWQFYGLVLLFIGWVAGAGLVLRGVSAGMIVDGWIIPEDHEIYYSELVLRLPCYQPNDRQRVVSPRQSSRQEVMLPHNEVVYCCFNGIHKITRYTFERWLKILSRVPGSVLWLLSSTEAVHERLRRFAAQQGIAASRLIFADKLIRFRAALNTT
jgi:hypothetical protein